MIGEVIDHRYRVLAKLGEGGMGEVYLAEHLTLGRKDALKILKPSLAGDPAFVSRFRREARATNRLSHPNIVRVHDFGKLADGRFFLAVEYVEGRSLAQVLDAERLLPVGRALGILVQLAGALDHAHSRGVVHRDLKPENLLLTTHRGRSDVLKVLDFGIAKIVAEDYAESLRLSNRGDIYGTATYISPEQVEGVGTDRRSDLYAIGCIAMEVLTGAPPFSGKVMELMRAHVTLPPEAPSHRLPPEVIPPELDEVILCCLQKDPARRFQNGRALRVALEQVPGFEEPSRFARRSWRASSPWHDQPAVEFDAPETVPEWAGPGRMGEMPAGGAETRGARWDALRERAAGAGGHGDSVDRVLAVAELDELDQELSRIDGELAAADQRADALEDAAHERDAGLGFALGELYYERQQTLVRTTAVGEIDRKIAEIEARLGQMSRAVQAELTALTDRSIALVAERATVEERFDAACERLSALLDQP